MEEILTQADALGDAIKNSDRFAKLSELELKVHQTPETKKILDDFMAKTHEIRQKEQNLQPVDVAEKRELSALEEAFRKDELLQEFIRAQADYAELINKVNERIFGKLAMEKIHGDDCDCGCKE